MDASTLYLIIPCYNEEHVLPQTAPVFLDKLYTLIKEQMISDNSRILFVNDGSTDDTWKIIRDFSRQDKHYLGISLSRNHGQQNSLLAGLMEAMKHCDITITMDCDGQDDIHAIDRMLDAYRNGFEIVYGVRTSRDSDSLFKRKTAEGFYKFMKLMGAELVYDHADFRLMSARALLELERFPESNLFLRGMVPLIGFPSTTVSYERQKRIAGSTHYSLKSMLSFAFEGITSFTIKPIRIITGIGIVFSTLSFIGILTLVIFCLLGRNTDGWVASTCVQCFLGGIQLICLGVIGEYIGKIYLETKARPRYIISERTFDPDAGQIKEA